MNFTGVALATTWWLSLIAAQTAAQQQPYPANLCTKAAQQVISGDAADTGLANTLILRCPDGPAVIAGRWRAAKGSPADLKQLSTWNLQVTDQRIGQAAIEVARDPGRSTNLRTLALKTLVIYFDPSVTGMVDLSPRLGRQPPVADMPDSVYAITRQLAADPDAAVAVTARLQWQALTDSRPSVARLPTGIVTLEAICGARFRIKNHSPIDLSVELTTTFGLSRGMRLAANSTRELGARDTGEVRLMLVGGGELAACHTGPNRCQ